MYTKETIDDDNILGGTVHRVIRRRKWNWISSDQSQINLEKYLLNETKKKKGLVVEAFP